NLPGRYFMAVRFRGKNGTITLAHVPFRVRGEKVREAWAKNLGSAIQGAAAIWQDLAIVPTLERGVYALSLDDGKEIWHREAPVGHISGRVVVDGDTIYYGAGSTVYACEARTGKPLWQTPVKGTIVASMTASAGRLYVPAGEHKLYCLDARQGKRLWDYTVGLPILMAPTVGDGKVSFGAMDGYLRCLDAVTGKEIWKYQLSPKEDRYSLASYWPPVLADGKVIVNKRPARKGQKNLVAFDADSGKIIWSRAVVGWPARLALNPKKDRLYASHYENRRRGTQCFSVEDGSPLWKASGAGMAAANASGDDLLVRDGYRSLYCLDAATGKFKWRYRVSVGPQGVLFGASAMIVKDNLVVVGTMDGYIIALKW
ncbi:MAG: PQQ-binding-like beta-propeller repeat protein, partial [Phycisphaerae bacterium]|nr:PQQ-binding-like beta-propeller repeat protein [Phycisphaerae bacterium]